MFENRRIAIFLGIAPIYLLIKTTALHGLNTFHSSFNHGIGLKLCKQAHVLIERVKEELSFTICRIVLGNQEAGMPPLISCSGNEY